jgi:hypothetical protein
MNLTDIYTLLTSLALSPVYPDNLPEDATFPCLIYSEMSDESDHTLDQTPVGTATAEIKLEIVSPDASQANKVATQYKAALDGYRGTNGQTFSRWSMQHESTESINYPDGGDTWMSVKQQEYDVRHNSPANAVSSGSQWQQETASGFSRGFSKGFA